MSEYAELAVVRLREAFEPARDPARATAMAAYMRNLFPFIGIPTPVRERLQREALHGMPKPSRDDLEATASALWALPEREYQYAACGLLARNAPVLDESSLGVMRTLVESKSWWDTVDTLASHVVGPVVLRHEALGLEMDRWVTDSNFWVVRAAILHQLRFKGATNAERLFRYSAMRAGDGEFFIRKAIGWALREYSKTDPEAVRSFVAAHEAQLSHLSRREALLWLNGGRRARLAAAD